MYYQKKTLDKEKTGILIMSAIANSKLSYEKISINLELNSSRVIYDWVAGKKLPSIENLFNLSIMLNVKMEELIALR